jgi:hypothetical protein
MLIEPKKVEINGRTFEIRPMRALKAARLDRKLLSILVPAIGGLGELRDLSGGATIDMEALAAGLQKGLASMSDDDFTAFVAEMVSTTVCHEPGKPPIELSDAAAVDAVFTLDLSSLYALIFEVAKYHKFIPFALLSSGGRILQTLGLNGLEMNEGETGRRSEKSES